MRSLARYTPPPDTRPRPINDAANDYVRWLGVTASLIVAAVGYGLVSIEQGDALQGLLGAIPGVMTAVTTVLTAFGIVRRAEPEVTPLSSPRARDGSRLTPLSVVGDRAAVHHDSGRALATLHDEQFRTVDWWDAEDTATGAATDADGDVSDEFEDTDTGNAGSEPAEAVVTEDRDTTARAADDVSDGRGDYRPPDSYPVADTPADGHHSPNNDTRTPDSGGGSW